MHADQGHRPEAVVLIKGTDGTSFERRYPADIARAIVALFNANARQSGVGAHARVVQQEAN